MPTNKQKFNKKYGFKLNEPHSLNDIAKTTKIKKSILQSVYNRGTGAWKGKGSIGQRVETEDKGAKSGLFSLFTLL